MVFMTLENVMTLLCGLGLFLYGMKLMGDGLEMAAGSRGVDRPAGDGGYSELFGDHGHGGRLCKCWHHAAGSSRRGDYGR